MLGVRRAATKATIDLPMAHVLALKTPEEREAVVCAQKRQFR